jgi:hypothetical protein
MLESTLSSLLIAVAGKYAHVSAPDVGVGLSGGRLVLDNVRLRADALDFQALPFAIVAGRAGRLRVNVPWSALSHTPVTIYLENVHLIAGPRKGVPGENRRQARKARRARARDMSPAADNSGKDVDSELERGDGSSTSLENEDYDSDQDEYAEEDEIDETSAGQGWSKDEREGAMAHAGKSVYGIGASHDRWHETLLGRLGFNVAVEVFGLKVEYRDQNCVSVISLASCQAYSADRNWEPAFVPLDGGGIAVAMRKVVKLNGLHWVMLPRRAPTDESEFSHQSSTSNVEELRLEQAAHSLPEPNNEGRRVRPGDLDAFEDRSPILDGIDVTFKVLLCNSEGAESGFHVDLDLELEEPVVQLSARQLYWMDAILRQGNISEYGVHSDKYRPRERMETAESISTYILRGAPAAGSRDGPSQKVCTQQHAEIDGALHNGTDKGSQRVDIGGSRELPRNRDSDDGQRGDISDFESGLKAANREQLEEKAGHIVDDVTIQSALLREQKGGPHPKNSKASASGIERNISGSGRFRTLWQAIVGENGDESVDDAAVALGYSKQAEIPRPALESDPDDYERYHARQAVSDAAAAGGFTFRVRATTPDLATRIALETLKVELENERAVRSRLEDVEIVVSEADKRVVIAENELAALRARNTSLVSELQDLERMARSANTSKDVMIRQMEAALMKAERQLQAVAQEQVRGNLPRNSVDPIKSEEFRCVARSVNDAPAADGNEKKHVNDGGRRKPAASSVSSGPARDISHAGRKTRSELNAFQDSSNSKVGRGRKVVIVGSYGDERLRKATSADMQKLDDRMTDDGLTLV